MLIQARNRSPASRRGFVGQEEFGRRHRHALDALPDNLRRMPQARSF
jgi:hypothetical protein